MCPLRVNDLLKANALNRFLKSNCRYLFTFVLVSGCHWALLIIDREIKKVEYYDSKPNPGEEDYERTIKDAKKIAKNLVYEFEEKITKSIQLDTYQCGIWVLYFLEERIKNPNISFNTLSNPSKLIANFREHVSASFLVVDQVLKARRIAGRSHEVYTEMNSKAL